MLYVKHTGHVALRKMYYALHFIHNVLCVMHYVKRITYFALRKMYYAL